jgi:hypothetical protein
MALDTFTRNGSTVEIDYCPDTDSPHDTDSLFVKLCLFGGRNYTFPNDDGIAFADHDGWPAVADELARRHGALMVTPVWVYEHSGIMLKAGARTYPFDCQWDSAPAGFAYITQETYRTCMLKRYTGHATQVRKVEQAIAAEVELYGQWVNGETYGYTVTYPDGEQDSCGGYVGYDAVKEAAEQAAG